MKNLKIKKQLNISFLFLLYFFVFTINNDQNKLTKGQWQSDLSWLQRKIHKDYPHLFYNVSADQFDSAVARLRGSIPLLSENEIRAEFFRLVALFKIGHTGIKFKYGEDPDSLKALFHYYPVTVYPFTDGLYIKSIDEEYRDAVGGKIIKVGNEEVNVALHKLEEVIPCENEQYFRSNLSYFFCLPELLQALKITGTAKSVQLTYLKDGKERTIDINAEKYPQESWHPEPYLADGWVDAYPSFGKSTSVYWMKNPEQTRYFEYIGESRLLYVRHSTVEDETDETIAEFFKKVFDFADGHEVDKFVLDIRLNGGGNNYLNKPVITGIIQSKQINRYGHLFVITGAATFSAAQNLTNELEKYTEALFVGEPTAENVNYWGDVQTEVLPNSKLNVVLSALWWQNMDPRDKRQWTPPHLAAGMSFENYRSGYDSAMNIILNFKEEVRIDEKIKALADAGNIDQSLVVMKQYMEDPLHRYRKNDLEEKINDMAYSYLMRNKLAEANRFFYMNVLFFPRSANAYDSYAESLYRLGKKEEAIKNYQVAIRLDPNGSTGENSRKMLILIKDKYSH